MGEKKPSVDVFTLSHRGLVRGNNEDRALFRELRIGKTRHASLAVLADGVGGHTAGEIAAQIAVDTITGSLANNLPKVDVHGVIEEAILAANQAILEDTAKNPKNSGMGTTCVVALIIKRNLYTAHLGDSRLYLFRKRTLHLLTKDHTMLAEMRMETEAQPGGNDRDHPMAHILSRYLGTNHALEVDQRIFYGGAVHDSLKLKPNDTLLLCSDGVTDLLNSEEIAQTLATCAGRKRAQTLIFRALEKGGHDNATAVVLDIR